MSLWELLCVSARLQGHDVDYEWYDRKSGTRVFYITNIDGIKYLKRWPEQKWARAKIREIVGGK